MGTPKPVHNAFLFSNPFIHSTTFCVASFPSEAISLPNKVLIRSHLRRLTSSLDRAVKLKKSSYDVSKKWNAVSFQLIFVVSYAQLIMWWETCLWLISIYGTGPTLGSRNFIWRVHRFTRHLCAQISIWTWLACSRFQNGP